MKNTSEYVVQTLIDDEDMSADLGAFADILYRYLFDVKCEA